MSSRRLSSRRASRKDRRRTWLQGGLAPRVLQAEQLESRMLLAGDLNFHNALYPQDVDQNQYVSPRDLLVIINQLNAGGARQLLSSSESQTTDGAQGEAGGGYLFDVNNDGALSASDALRVINYLNSQQGEHAEIMEFRIVLLQPGTTNPLPNTITKGTDFEIAVIVQDLRGPDQIGVLGDRGVLNASIDLNLNTKALAQVENEEVQTLRILGNPTGGTFTLTFNDGTVSRTTSPIQYNPLTESRVGIATRIQNALSALSNIGAGNIEVVPGNAIFGGDANAFAIRFQGALGDKNLPLNITGNAANLTGGTNPSISVTELFSGTPNAESFRTSLLRRYQIVAGQLVADYNSVVTGADASNPDRIDDLGGLHSDALIGHFPDGEEADPRMLARVRMNTLDAGSFTLQGDVQNVGENLLYVTDDPDHEDKVLLPHEIKITNPAALKIIEPFSAIADTFTFNEDPGSQTLNVTANDTTNNTTTGSPTGALPANVVIISTTAPSLGGSVSINTGGKTLNYTPAANASGTETFTYTLRNPSGVTDTATVTITLNPVNDPPINAVPGARTVAEDGTLVFANNLSISDADAGSASVQTSLVVSNGTLTLPQTTGLTFIAGDGNADSTVTFQGTVAAINAALNGLQYTPNANYNGSDTLQIITSDLGNTPAPAQTDSDSVAITVTAVNDAPALTVPGNQSAVETVATTLAAISVSDVDFQATSPSDMEITLAVDGIGTLSLPSTTGLTFSAGDGTDDATMTFSGNLTNVNAALAAISYTAGLGDAAAPRTLTITANDNGSVGSGGALQDQQTVTIDVIPLDRPFARDDAFTVDEDSLSSTPANSLPVLANDFKDADKTLVIVEFTQPANGTVTQVGDQLVYVPNADFFGTDTFRYTINQTPDPKAPGDLDEDQIATVTVTVTNTPDNPVANADSATTDEDTAVDIAVMANDIDVDLGLTPATQIPTAATHTVVIVTQPANGTASVNVDGTVKYTPAANFSGSDSFTYQLTDANGTSLAATVSLTVNPVNDAPVAAADGYSTNEDTTLTISSPGVLGNDTDIDSGTITVSSVTQQPTKGSLTLNADGSFTYIPNSNANGTDTFKYRATDGSLTSNEATVTITINAVNDAPVAVDDAYSATEDTTRNVTVFAQGLIGNDSDVDNAQNQLSVSFFSQPANGTVSVNANGTFSYTPALDFIGTDTFTYRISDGSLESNTATVTMVVQEVNDPSTAVNDSYSVDEDGTLVVSTPETGVQGNDQDPDTVLALRRAVLVGGTSNGSLTLNQDGTFTYTPNANFFGSDSFTYQVDDGENLSNVATVTITVNAVNDNPVVADDIFTAIKHNPPTQDFANQQINVLANDQVGDPDPGETLTIIAVSDPANGTAVIAADGKSVLYTPDLGYEGPDSFTYTVEDNGTNPSNLQSTATVNIDVVNFIPTDISGTVWTDVDNDGVIDSVERRLAGAEVRLVGTSFRNQSVDVTVNTDVNGRYVFVDVEPGDYRIIETTPEYMRDGKDSYNTTTKGFDTDIPIVTGSGNDFCDIHIPLLSTDNVAKVLENINFGEIGLDSAYINLAELLASTTTNGMIIAVGSGGEQLWHSQLDGWSNMKSCTLTASADFSSATLTVTDMAGNVYTKTLTQTGTTRFRVIGQDGDDGYLIRVEGTSAQHELSLSAGQEGEDNYASDVDAVMSSLGNG